MRTRRLGPLFGALVASASAGALAECDGAPQTPDAGPDATSDDVAIVPYEAAVDDVVDAPIDSYVDWCEAGPPSEIADAGCYRYYYVPCGVPSGDVVDDAGAINRCDQICSGAADDQCAVLPPPWIDVLEDAGLIDAGTAATAEAGAVFVRCACAGSAGRRPEGLAARPVRATTALGETFARMAQLEAASVPAFLRLRGELERLGAPAALARGAAAAADDERRHARIMARLARRFGATAPRPRVRRMAPREAEAIARENAVEGCVRETFGALVATWQARAATDLEVRRAMRLVARDETRHAELSLAVDAFLDGLLDPRARARVRAARRRAIAALRVELAGDAPPARVAGLPSAVVARRLCDGLFGAETRAGA